MREPFEDRPDDPVEAARRTVRPALRRRFYEKAGVAAIAGGYAVQLDGKPVHTPARRVLVAPSAALAGKTAVMVVAALLGVAMILGGVYLVGRDFVSFWNMVLGRR